MKLIPTILVSVGLGATPLLAADDPAHAAVGAADTVPVTIVTASGGG